MAKKKILSDHKQKGKKLIPIMMQGNFLSEINWLDDFVPELFWIACVQKKLGYKTANEVLLELHELYLEISDSKYPHNIFSSYSSLKGHQKSKLLDRFKSSKSYDKLLMGIKDLQYFYPGHPLEFLYSNLELSKEDVDLEFIKSVLGDISFRRSKEAMYAQALVLYVAMATGKLIVTKESSLLGINEIKEYPDTEKSRQIASSIRASFNGILGNKDLTIRCDWANNFWVRSFELERPHINLQK
ncbi:hypothetical protein [Flagellimonas flava]|uniref:Uncharacterized protein n=1 Tax=Flagellimonas flava TaxID=570519 RepID=A0A1M5N783_9FLAO|nr:hypothetical protein [Allomuricauda flava]SHG85404.1 hypothetical protein SAMN04488116_2697 [Allomuricauda flava]